MSFKIYPYKPGSASAKALANALNGKVLKHVGSKFKPRLGDVVINWGASAPPKFAPATTLNSDVTDAQCKLATLKTLNDNEINVPSFCTNKGDIPHDWFPVVCRTKLRGHSGDGIVIANAAAELVPAPLYTKYIKKKDEYRVHVLRDNVFFVQRKARKLGHENPNWQVRNLAGGFAFVEVGQDDVPGDVLDSSVRSIAALGLDFGGVDVMWNEQERKAYVLEINTACGLEERTAVNYADAFRAIEDRGR